jgi:hypothetical protein
MGPLQFIVFAAFVWQLATAQISHLRAGGHHAGSASSHHVSEELAPGWVMEGFIEIVVGNDWDPYNVTTIPVGRCVPNILAPEGRFMRVLANTEFYPTALVRAESFSDLRCQKSVGSPFDLSMSGLRDIWGFYYDTARLGYVSERTPHAMGPLMRKYNRADCSGTHIDVYNKDGNCQQGFIVDPLSSSYSVTCQNGFAIEYSGDWCTGNSTQYDIANTIVGTGGSNLTNCLLDENTGGSHEIVCGGLTPTPYPTYHPTHAPPVPWNVIDGTDVNVWISSMVGPKLTNYYLFNWTLGAADGNAILLQTLSHVAFLYVNVQVPGQEVRDCNVGSWQCNQCASQGYGIVFNRCPLSGFANFDENCSGPEGCLIQIAVFGHYWANNDYRIDISVPALE